MIVIKKGPEPDGLSEFRKLCESINLSPKAAYKELKSDLKRQIVECLKRDQGHLCVYCMSRIPRADRGVGIPGETIEHYIPLDPKDGRDLGQGLDYQNLYLVCHGNVRPHRKGTGHTISKDDLTCDKHRGNIEFRKIDPVREETLQTIYYTMDGEIKATDPDVEYDLTQTLNLNCRKSPIVSERKAALDALIEDMGQVPEDEMQSYCSTVLEGFKNEGEKKTPYVGILIWYLQSMIEAIA